MGGDRGTTGCGIAPENLSRIFDPSSPPRAVSGGAPAWACLACGIVRKHGGRIDVDSEPGAAPFRVTIPVQRSRAAAADTAAAARTPVLCVDDRPNILASLQRVLRRARLGVLTAAPAARRQRCCY